MSCPTKNYGRIFKDRSQKRYLLTFRDVLKNANMSSEREKENMEQLLVTPDMSASIANLADQEFGNQKQLASASFGFQPGDLSLGVRQRDVWGLPETLRHPREPGDQSPG